MESNENVKVSIKSKSPTGRTQTHFDYARTVPFEDGMVFSLKSNKRIFDRKRFNLIKSDILNTFYNSYRICDIVMGDDGVAIFAKQTITNEHDCLEVRVHSALYDQ